MCENVEMTEIALIGEEIKNLDQTNEHYIFIKDMLEEEMQKRIFMLNRQILIKTEQQYITYQYGNWRDLL